MTTPSASSLRVAIVGATSLKGQEVKAVLEERLLPVKHLALVDDDEAVGQLTEFEGEPSFVQRLDPELFAENEVVFFASTTGAFTRGHWESATAGHAALIDLSHALLDVSEASVRVPFLEGEFAVRPAPARPWYIAPHAAAIILLTLYARLRAAFRLRRVVAHVFEPVSERGAAGLQELQEQTVRLLSFQEFPRTVFDAQVAFNLLAAYGAGSRVRLEEVEDTIRREVERAAPELAERLALRVLQAPIFHSECVSAFVELEEPAESAAVERALDGERVIISSPDGLSPAAVDAAGQEEILIGPVVRNPGPGSGFWLWAAADNLRLVARTAVDIAETLVA